MPVRISLLIVCAAALLGEARRAAASPIQIPVDTAHSVVEVEFCLGSSCSTDTSNVIGVMDFSLDSVTAPTVTELADYVLSLTDQINIALTGLTATGNGISIEYATPGLPQPPVVLGPGGSFAYSDVPSNQSGTVNYTATGTTCLLMTLAGIPCTGSINLADQGVLGGDFAGTIVALPGRIVRISVSFEVSGPVNPDVPALGTLTVSGTIVGETTVPRRADLDGNGIIDGRDVPAFVDTLLAPGSVGAAQRYAADMNDDNEFDINDAALFAACVAGGSCPD